ncbi:MAG: hypothetical protein V2B18_18770 [Pseudomonadota bacterium]
MPRAVIRVAVVWMALALSMTAPKAWAADQAHVAVLFFSSRDCHRCTHVSMLLDSLRERYPVRVKKYDIARPSDYALFEKLEAIHAEGRFDVPLVIVGDSILIGEDKIIGELETIVDRLRYSGGAGFPYLGVPDKK